MLHKRFGINISTNHHVCHTATEVTFEPDPKTPDPEVGINMARELLLFLFLFRMLLSDLTEVATCCC